MSGEITRRGFLALIAALAGTSILPKEAIAEPDNPDHTRTYRMSWAIERGGEIVEEFREEDGFPIGFEVHISVDTDTDFFGTRRSMITRKEVTLKLWGKEYIVPKMKTIWREKDSRTVMVLIDPILYDPEYDQVRYVVGDDMPRVIQGLRG